MTTAAPSTALATIQPAFTDAERLALSGFLAGYRALTREAYALDLRQFTTWCRARSVALFAVHRAGIEKFRPGTRSPGPGPRHRYPAAMHQDQVTVLTVAPADSSRRSRARCTAEERSRAWSLA